MRTYYRVLTDSGMKRPAALLAVLRAHCAFAAPRRQLRLETLLSQRKEICEIKDAVVSFGKDLLKKTKRSGNIGRSQIVDDLYRREHSSRLFNVAIKELLKQGVLQRVELDMPDEVYVLTARRYISKTHLLTAMLTKMGLYARAVAEHRPYHYPRQQNIDD